MKIFKFITLVLVLIICFAFTYFAYLGGLRKVSITENNFKAVEIIYTGYKGPYSNMKEPWENFVKEAQKAGLENCDAYGVYLDDPETPEENLRSILACAINELSPDLQEKLKTQFASFTIPNAESFYTSFPYTNEFSFFIAPTRVYPEYQKLIAANAFQPSVAIEAYGFDEGRTEILFYMPKSKNQADYQPLFDFFK